jgi:hypothetical protein
MAVFLQHICSRVNTQKDVVSSFSALRPFGLLGDLADAQGYGAWHHSDKGSSPLGKWVGKERRKHVRSLGQVGDLWLTWFGSIRVAAPQ